MRGEARSWAAAPWRLYLAFAAAVLAILLGTAATSAALRDWEVSNGILSHTYEVRDALSQVLVRSLECEAAVRGHLIAGSPPSLERFRDNEKKLPPALDTVERLVSDNSAQSARAHEARTLVSAMLSEMNAEILQQRMVAPRLVRDVRGKLIEMMEEESALLARRRRAWLDQRTRVVLVDSGGSVLLLVLAAVAALAVRGDLRRREQRAREKAALYQFQERLISIVGHDLRNPLSAVMVSTQFLLKQKNDLREGQVQAVERISRSASRIDALGNLLVDFTAARLGGGIPLRRERSDARPAVERAVDELRSANPRRAIEVQAKTDRTSGDWDVERIAQIVSNLVSNAIRYGEKDAPITVSIDDAEPDSLEIAVHNHGQPISDELVPHLFEPYKRGAEARAAYTSGLGLGLYIVREIVSAHRGEVSVASRAKDGTTFCVRLPRAAPRIPVHSRHAQSR